MSLVEKLLVLLLSSRACVNTDLLALEVEATAPKEILARIIVVMLLFVVTSSEVHVRLRHFSFLLFID